MGVLNCAGHGDLEVESRRKVEHVLEKVHCRDPNQKNLGQLKNLVGSFSKQCISPHPSPDPSLVCRCGAVLALPQRSQQPDMFLQGFLRVPESLKP